MTKNDGHEVTKFSEAEHDFSKSGTLINEWEKLTAPSNRRLSVQTFDTPLKISWSIDRITIVGKLKEIIHYRRDSEVLEIDFEMLMSLNEQNGHVKKLSWNSWQVMDKYDENIAFIEVLQFQKGYGRIDFNPNKINKFVAGGMKTFIHKLFEEPHFSRADIACDIIDVPNEFIRQYRVVDPVSFKPIFGRSGELETAYWGARSSERQIRMYNKKLEQTNKKHIVPKEIKTWWRVELQLRRGKAEDWFNMVNESLDSFCSTFFLAESIKWTDKIMIVGLMSDQNLWSGLHRQTKYKYRNLIKSSNKNDDLTNIMRETFYEQSQKLKNELDSWLNGLDVSDENI